jgi:hypothetical protein
MVIEVGVWSHQFTQKCFLPVTKALLASNPPDHRTIKALDNKILAFTIPMSSHNSDRASQMQFFVREHFSPLSASPESPSSNPNVEG